MSSPLCQVAAFTNVAEAEWARCRLGYEGIPARLDNASLVLWFWHYSQLTGGVKLLTTSDDAQRACAILDKGPLTQAVATWPCPGCGEQSPDNWTTCWRCGTASDGTEDAEFFKDHVSTPTRFGTDGGIALVSLFGILVYMGTANLFAGFLSWLILMGLVIIVCGPELTDPTEVDEPEGSIRELDLSAEPEPVLSAAEQSFRRPRRLGHDVAWRAAWISMLAITFFVPLVLFSLPLLFRLTLSKIRLRGLDRVYLVGGWLLSLLCVALAVWLVLGLLGYVTDLFLLSWHATQSQHFARPGDW